MNPSHLYSVEYGVVLDDQGSTTIYDTEAEARACATPETPIVRIVTTPIDAPSAQPPTREQIAEAIARSQDGDYWVAEIAEWEAREDWEREAYADDRPGSAYDDRDSYLKDADAVLALFPQPTPSAEPKDEIEACPECGGLGYDVDWADPPSQGPCGSCGGSGNLDQSTIRDVTPPKGVQ